MELLMKAPMILKKEINQEIGIYGAIILDKINYWINKNQDENRNFVDGKYWTYNSIRIWHEDYFDFISYSTVKNAFKKLEDTGYLISANHNKHKWDKTKWYTINYIKLDAFLSDIENKWEKILQKKKTKNKQIILKEENRNIQNARKSLKYMNSLSIKTDENNQKKEKNSEEKTYPIDWSKFDQPIPLNNTIYNSSYIYPSSSTIKTKNKWIDRKNKKDYKKYKNQFRKQLGYYENLHAGNTNTAIQYDEIINVLTDIMMLHDDSFVRINQQQVRADIIKEKFCQLNESHMEDIFFAFENNINEIKNPRAYLLTVAYNAINMGELIWNTRINNTYIQNANYYPKMRKLKTDAQKALDVSEEELYNVALEQLVQMAKEENKSHETKVI